MNSRSEHWREDTRAIVPKCRQWQQKQRRKSEVACGLPIWDLPKTTTKMLGCCPRGSHTVFLFLGLLPPSLLSTGNFLSQYPVWESYPGLALASRNFHHHEAQNPRHMWHRRSSKQKPCQATPDIYFVLDK